MAYFYSPGYLWKYLTFGTTPRNRKPQMPSTARSPPWGWVPCPPLASLGISALFDTATEVEKHPGAEAEKSCLLTTCNMPASLLLRICHEESTVLG